MAGFARVIPIGGRGTVSARGEPAARGEGAPGRAVESRLKPELVAAAQAGDLGAQAEIFAQSWPLVHGLVRRLLGADHESSDLAQDVFVLALSKLDSLRDPSAFEFWLRGITIRLVRRRLRTRKLLRRLGLLRSGSEEDVGGLVSSQIAPEQAAQLREFLALLARVDDETRLLLFLRHVEEMSLPEIAAHLGLSLSTIKRRFQSAQLQLESLTGDRSRAFWARAAHPEGATP